MELYPHLKNVRKLNVNGQRLIGGANGAKDDSDGDTSDENDGKDKTKTEAEKDKSETGVQSWFSAISGKLKTSFVQTDTRQGTSFLQLKADVLNHPVFDRSLDGLVAQRARQSVAFRRSARSESSLSSGQTTESVQASEHARWLSMFTCSLIMFVSMGLLTLLQTTHPHLVKVGTAINTSGTDGSLLTNSPSESKSSSLLQMMPTPTLNPDQIQQTFERAEQVAQASAAGDGGVFFANMRWFIKFYLGLVVMSLAFFRLLLGPSFMQKLNQAPRTSTTRSGRTTRKHKKGKHKDGSSLIQVGSVSAPRDPFVQLAEYAGPAFASLIMAMIGLLCMLFAVFDFINISAGVVEFVSGALPYFKSAKEFYRRHGFSSKSGRARVKVDGDKLFFEPKTTEATTSFVQTVNLRHSESRHSAQSPLPGFAQSFAQEGMRTNGKNDGQTSLLDEDGASLLYALASTARHGAVFNKQVAQGIIDRHSPPVLRRGDKQKDDKVAAFDFEQNKYGDETSPGSDETSSEQQSGRDTSQVDGDISQIVADKQARKKEVVAEVGDTTKFDATPSLIRKINSAMPLLALLALFLAIFSGKPTAEAIGAVHPVNFFNPNTLETVDPNAFQIDSSTNFDFDDSVFPSIDPELDSFSWQSGIGKRFGDVVDAEIAKSRGMSTSDDDSVNLATTRGGSAGTGLAIHNTAAHIVRTDGEQEILTDASSPYLTLDANRRYSRIPSLQSKKSISQALANANHLEKAAKTIGTSFLQLRRMNMLPKWMNVEEKFDKRKILRQNGNSHIKIVKNYSKIEFKFDIF